MYQVLRGVGIGMIGGLTVALALGSAGAQSDEHGRKYKAMPPTAHIVVTVEKGFNEKPLPNAAVVFHAVREGKNDGNLEVKTDPDGKATIDVIEVGSQVTVQVIAPGFATSATELNVDGPSKELLVKLQRPRAQMSQYQDNQDKPAQVQPGIQVHQVPKPSPASPATAPNTPPDPSVPASTPPTADPTQPAAVPASPSTASPTPAAPPATTPGSTAPGSTAPGNTAPGNTAPGNTAPGNTAPGNTAPGNTAPGSTAPGTSPPASGTPSTAPPSGAAPSPSQPGARQ